MDVKIMIDVIFVKEGGYVNYFVDRGGFINFGII